MELLQVREGLDSLRTVREALLLEDEDAVWDIRPEVAAAFDEVVDAEAVADEFEADVVEAAADWDIRRWPDEDELDEDELDDWALLELVAKVEAADVVTAGPGGPRITWTGCGGGERGQLLSNRLIDEARLLLDTGGGDKGISTMGLGERVGIKSDCPLERKMPLRTGQGAWLFMFWEMLVGARGGRWWSWTFFVWSQLSNCSICLNDKDLNESADKWQQTINT